MVREQRRIADEQRRVRAREHRGEIGSHAWTNTGAIPKCRAHSTRVNATDVRELVSSAMVRTCSIGTDVKSATDATGPSDATAQPGTMA